MANQPNELEILMARVRDGDNDAAQQVVDKYGHHIRTVIRSLLDKQPLRRDCDSEDIMQMVWEDFFLKCVHKQTFENEKRLLHYLAGMAHNKVLQKRRRMTSQKRDFRRRVRLDNPAVSEERDLVDGRATPEETLSADEQWDHLLQDLPPQVRRALAMLRQGHTQQEIAAVLNVSARCVRRLIDGVRTRPSETL